MATPTLPQLAIARLYTALFNRAPDADGFAFWVSALQNGASPATLAQAMLGAPEALALYPAGQTDPQFVTAFYANVFGRAPDADGLAFWTAALAAQGGAGSPAARASLAMQIGAIAATPLTVKPEGMSDAAYAQTVADRARFINKTEFGVYFASELKSNDLALAKATLALLTDSPASVIAATNVAMGIGADPGTPPTPSLAITSADSATLITSKFAAYTATNATVNATGMAADQLSAVAAAVGKVAADGITGTIALNDSLSDVELAALLGSKTATGATVTVNASGMSVAKVVQLGLGAAKVDSLSNLPTVLFSNAAYTDAVTAGLFAIAAPGSMQLAAAGSASDGELALIAANVGKISTLTGAINLTRTASTATMTGLLDAKIGGLGGAITIVPAGMSGAQLGVVAAKLAGVAGLVVNSEADAATITTVLGTPGITAVDVSVSAAGMTSAQIDAVAGGAAAIRTLSVDASIDATLITTLLSAPNMGPVNVSVSGVGMSAGQIAAVGAGVVNVDSVSGLPTLVLSDPLITDAVTAGLLAKGSNLTVVASDASAAERSSLLANLSSVAANGISGTLSLSLAELSSVTPAALGPKLAAGATVGVLGTAAKNTIDVSAWSVGMRIDGGAGADRIVLGGGADTVFVASRNDSRSAPSLTDTDTSNIETIANFRPQDVIRFSTLGDAFGTGISIRPGAITPVAAVTNAVDILTLADVINAASVFGAVYPGVASTSAQPMIVTVNAYAYNNGVTPGALANKTFFILNDENPAITLDDTIIAVDNYLSTIGVGTAKFEAGL